MKVVILCGGRGTRLQEETEYRPKPMVPIGPQPILWHIMKYYAQFGHKEFILCLGYKGEMIKEYFRNYPWIAGDVSLKLGRAPSIHFHDNYDEESWSVTLAETGLETMTGGRIRRIRRHLGEDKEFLLTYGDGVGNIDITASIAWHRKHFAVLFHRQPRGDQRAGILGRFDYQNSQAQSADHAIAVRKVFRDRRRRERKLSDHRAAAIQDLVR